MIKSREVISTSLEHALLANRVLAALASQDLASDEAQEAMKEGLQFLKSVLKGGELANSRSVQPDSYNAALAYGESVKTFELIRYQEGQNQDPTPYLQELVDCFSALRQQGGHGGAVQELTSFFRAIRDISLAANERAVERVSW